MGRRSMMGPMDAAMVAAAVPVFFALMAVEWIWSHSRGRSTYRFSDAVASLGCGIVQQVVAVYQVFLVVGVYALIAEALAGRGWALPLPLWAQWVVAFVGVDLAYYLFHRASHRVNILWATHVVHHQSEEYNLSTALRQGFIQGAAAAPFYWPLAVLGVTTPVFVACATINTLYQFWIHTRLIKKLPGPVEALWNTPSHHRVHHGIDPEYIDKNYAGVFIVWDRLFGTFLAEGAVEPNYGVVQPLRSFNPLWAQVHYFLELGRVSLRAQRWKDKIWVWFAPPEWGPADWGGLKTVPAVDRRTRALYDVPVPLHTLILIATQFAMVTGATLLLQLYGANWGALRSTPLIAWVCLTALGWGGHLEGKVWVRALTIPRMLCLLGAGAVYIGYW